MSRGGGGVRDSVARIHFDTIRLDSYRFNPAPFRILDDGDIRHVDCYLTSITSGAVEART